MSPLPSEFSLRDQARMARALYLAALARNACDPNPRVGCVIDAEGEIAGEGWHRRAGEAHAEVNALREAGARARGATVYLTLEPCCHHGRTGPCTSELIDAGVARVVCAMTDPNPQVDGGGADRLRRAGIDVATGLMRAQAEELNRGFVQRMVAGRPYVTSKIAASLDGRTALADGASQWITGEAARADVQRMRARSSAILTGIGTVLADDPRLSVRLEDDGSWIPPARVIVDSGLRTPESARVFAAPGKVLLFSLQPAAAARKTALTAAGGQVETVSPAAGGVDLAAVMASLAAAGYNEVLVEAGARLNGALLDAGLVDELVVYQAPVLLGPAARPMFAIAPVTAMAQRPGFDLKSLRRVGPDWRLRLVPRSL